MLAQRKHITDCGHVHCSWGVRATKSGLRRTNANSHNIKQRVMVFNPESSHVFRRKDDGNKKMQI
jgi:hypothetical protein